MTSDPPPEIEILFLKIMKKSMSASTTEDAELFAGIIERLCQAERNIAAAYASATDIVQAAKHEMNLCGCPYEMPVTGRLLADARRIKVVHRRDCPRHRL